MTQKTNNQDITSESEAKEGRFIKVFILPLILVFNMTLLGLFICKIYGLI